MDLPTGAEALQDVMRLVLAAVLGGLLGSERQRLGKRSGWPSAPAGSGCRSSAPRSRW